MTDDQETHVSHASGKLVIVRNGQQMSIASPCPEILERLVTKVLRFLHDDRHGCRISVGTEPLLRPPQLPARPNSDQRSPFATAGLELIVRYLARKCGFDVQRQGYRPGPTCLTEPDVEAVGKGGPCDSQLLSFVRRFEHGLIRHRPGVNRCWLLAQMIRAWPDASFAIATASYPEAWRIRKGLFRVGVKSTLATARYCPDRPGRVVIGTYTAMGHNQIECNKRDIFVSGNAAHALGEQAQRCLIQVDSRFRLFGLLPDDHRLSPSEKDRLVAAFGVREIVIPAHGFSEARPNIVWVPFRWHDRVGETADVLAVKRRLIWRHPIRNRRIARLGKTLVAGDTPALAADFDSVHRAVGNGRACRVVVLVDGLTHALALAERLPKWPIVAGRNISRAGLSGKQRRLLAERQRVWVTGGKMIVTAIGAEMLDISTASNRTVIIWGSSGPHLPALPLAWRVVPSGVTGGLLVVDIADYGSSVLVEWTRRRRAIYGSNEWLAPGTYPLAERIKRFLATRPGRARTRP